MAAEDLKDIILELKRRLHTVSSENYLLKVKVRKLQTELNKKDKQMERLLDPNKTSCISKIVSERGASMIMNLKNKVHNLEEELTEKNKIIRKLNVNLQISKLYLPKETPTLTKNGINRHNSARQKECIHKDNKFRSRSLTVTPVPRSDIYLKSSSDIQMEYVRLAQNLQKIKLANNASKQSLTDLNKEKTVNTVENVLANSPIIENNINNKTNGSKTMEKHFESMLQDMEKLKHTVTYLTQEQEYTKKILKDKNRNIEILARKVKHLQKGKIIKASPQKIQENQNMSIPSSSSYTYSQESFEEEVSKENSPQNIKIELKHLNENPTEIKKNIESVSDDDDVQTEESK